MRIVDDLIEPELACECRQWLLSQTLVFGWKAHAEAPGVFWHRNFVLPGTHTKWVRVAAGVITEWITLDDARVGSAGLAEERAAANASHHLLYLLWATTQHYADFGHQIETLNGGAPLTDRQWQEATESVKTIILRGVGLG